MILALVLFLFVLLLLLGLRDLLFHQFALILKYKFFFLVGLALEVNLDTNGKTDVSKDRELS